MPGWSEVKVGVLTPEQAAEARRDLRRWPGRCPKCHAAAGLPCRTRETKSTTDTHQARL